MRLNRLYIQRLRNIETADIRGLSSINAFHGENGSGKSSLLESCHILATGKSFRAHQIQSLVQFGSSDTTIFGEVVSDSGVKHKLGCRKAVDETSEFYIDGERCQSIEQHARSLPLILVDPQVLSVVDGGPVFRRAFLDWGVFHVEHSFFSVWRRYRKALRQRNALLKQGLSSRELYAPWEQEMHDSGTAIARMRSSYFEQLVDAGYHQAFSELDWKLPALTLYQGFDTDNYAAQLEESFEKDLRMGYTSAGPQRADVRIKAGRFGADKILSRGQQKMTICALKIAQARLFNNINGYSPIVLLDDVLSELDFDNTARVLGGFVETASQLFVTAVDKGLLERVFARLELKEMKMFHVERGKINEDFS